MSGQTNIMSESFLTNITLIRFGIVMCLQMFFHVVIVTIGPRTFGTLIWFPFPMKNHMIFIGFLLSEALITDCALKGPIVRMQSAVFHIVFLLQEHFAAETTTIPFLGIVVFLHVLDDVLFRRENLTTHITFKVVA